MKCPKCNSSDTKKVYVSDPEWHIGHQRCQNPLCKYQGDWLEFCDLPIVFKQVIIDIGDNND
jgi:lipocalin